MSTKGTATLVVRAMDDPDERREPPLVRVDVTTIGDTTMARATAEPGWRWSTSIKPIAGTESCEVPHTGYMISGKLHILMDDGTEADLSPGQVFTCSAGHDGWVVGDQPAQWLEVSPAAATTYAAPSA